MGANRTSMLVDRSRFPIAYALLDAFDRPWSGRAIRFAAHALHRALIHGIDILESDRLSTLDTRACDTVRH